MNTFWGLTAAEWAAVAAAATAGLLLVSVWSLWITIRGERRRTQPLVVAHEAGERRYDTDSGHQRQVLDSYLTNDGGGPAFNVRFGVEYNGIRYPYKYAQEERGSGSRIRVVPVSGRLPLGAAVLMIGVPWEPFALGRARDERRVYWCRYENAYGQTWETKNPVERTADLKIRRVRFVWPRERLEAWTRQRIARKARRGLAADLTALAAEAEAAENADAADAAALTATAEGNDES